MLKTDKEGYYIIDTMDKLKEWHRMTDLSHTEKLALRAEMNPVKVKKSNPKQMNGVESDKPFVKTRKKKVIKKDVLKPEQTAFDKWFNGK